MIRVPVCALLSLGVSRPAPRGVSFYRYRAGTQYYRYRHLRPAMPEAQAVALTLSQRIVIGLVPATVPALVLIIALGIAVGIGELPESLGNAFEQIAGGALLITYMKELFPKVMESGDPAVAAIIKGSTDKSTVMHAKIAVTVLIVLSIATSAILQTAAAGFPGLNPEESGSGAGAENSFTPAETIAYFIGFFVDGVVLAYDDEPVACDLSLVKKMIMSLVFAIDNLLDGFGLVPVLKEAFGEYWWVIMFVFSGCVIAGALTTAMLRHCIPSPLFHTCFLSLATTSILVGALELTPHGLSVYVCVGIVAVWFVLFVGDLVSESDEEEGDVPHLGAHGLAAEPHAPPSTSLWSPSHQQFIAVVAQKKAQRTWRVNTTAVAFLGAARGQRADAARRPPAEVLTAPLVG